MKVAVASDHGGYLLKKEVLASLSDLAIDFVDFGCDSEEAVDYPDYARIVADKVASGEFDRGLLFCGTGLGMAIAANKVQGIRAVTVHDVFSAQATRAHNDSNILTMGGRVIGAGLADTVARAFLLTPFDGGRHQRRIDKITQMEEASNLTSDVTRSC
nr:ribose 5-phosphate isomerase B [Bacilli bacterium]